MGAARILLNKVLPDIKVSEFQVEENRHLGVVVLPEKDMEKLQSGDLSNEEEHELLNKYQD